MSKEQRLIFGDAAELYDEVRPSYPSAVFSDLVRSCRLKHGGSVLEIGAGTGKATAGLAAFGLSLTALEPSSEMAKLAKARFATAEHVKVVEEGFEEFQGTPKTFDVVLAAQSWHWISPEVRYLKSYELLRPSGHLVLMWNIPRWVDHEAREAVNSVYEEVVPGLVGGVLWSTGSNPVSREVMRHSVELETAHSSHFHPAKLRTYSWQLRYDTDQYVKLLSTQSDHLLLQPALREELLGRVGSLLDSRFSGSLTFSYTTYCYLAKRRAW